MGSDDLENWLRERLEEMTRDAEEERDPYKRRLKEARLECLSRVWKAAKAGKFDKTGFVGLRNYLSRAAKRAACDGARREKVHVMVSLSDKLAAMLPAQSKNVAKEVAQLCVAWFRQRGEWPLLARREIDGKSAAELATEEGVSIRTIQTLLSQERVYYRRLAGELAAFCDKHGVDSEEII